MNLEYATNDPDPVTGARALTRSSSAALLAQIIRGCHGRVVMFDLDSTLLDNRGRNAAIMQEFAQSVGEARLTTARASHWQDWSARNAMAAIGMSPVDIDRLIDPYTKFWEDRFFTTQYCQYDKDVAGAVQFVNELKQSGSIIRYLTGRHEEMRPGTLSSLDKLGFPVPETKPIAATEHAPGAGLTLTSNDVELIMKPRQSLADDEFKKSELAKFHNANANANAILAAFDNEPYHINAYRSAFPGATCVHLDTDHSMRPVRLLGGIVSIKNFLR